MMVRLFDPASGDTARLAALHAACFADRWTAQAMADLLATPNCFAFSNEDGFVMARVAGGEAEILTLAVNPPARRQGLGRVLVATAAAHAHALGASELFLEAGSGNAAARILYDRLGFRPVALRKGYYQGEDALVLKAALPLPPSGKFA
jgi:ribosomal-protein-alanine N-acetyltransferase